MSTAGPWPQGESRDKSLTVDKNSGHSEAAGGMEGCKQGDGWQDMVSRFG